MVLLLVIDVVKQAVDTAVVHRERSIAGLPGEVLELRIKGLDPTAAHGLHGLYDVGERLGARQGMNGVNVVGHTINANGKSTLPFEFGVHYPVQFLLNRRVS